MASRYEDNNRRGGKKKSGRLGSAVLTLLLVIAIGVFGYSAYTLYGYYQDYKAGTDEYDGLADKFTNLGSSKTGETDAADGAADAADADTASGEILSSIDELEDPDAAVVEAKAQSAAEDVTVENGEEKSLPLLVNPINFDELNAINDEIIGWIRVGALEVSYPIAQADDNDYYLHRTFEKQDNFAGCIFLNYSNSRYFTDQNSIVYGHNMKNGSMFGTLNKFRSQETYDGNPYFWIFTPTLIYQYQIFSAREISLNADTGAYTTRFTTDDFAAFLQTAQAQCEVDTHGLEITTDDRVVTLSTCTGNSSTRFIVQGKLFQIYISA